jgi:hypothetical protein
MTAWRVTLSLLSLIATAWHFAPLAASTPLPAVHEATAIVQSQDVEEFLDPADDELGRVDVLGNLIQDAVGDYRIDWSGKTYETHAPEVILTQLAQPGA